MYTISRKGQRMLLDIRDKRNITRKMEKAFNLSASRLTAEVFEETGMKVPSDTVRRILNESGYNGRIPRKSHVSTILIKRKDYRFPKNTFLKKEHDGKM